MIELANVSKCFNAGRPNRFDAIREVSCVIERERVTVLKGPSGSGKTTLLTLIGCMARPTSGRIVLSGIGTLPFHGGEDRGRVEITSLPERFLTGIRRTTFGFVFQQFSLVRGITVLENVMLPAYPGGEGHAAVRRRALELLETFSLSRHASGRVELLSGGELQRVAIARALINDPAVIIADEPTAHLDTGLSREFMEMAGSLRDGGKTVIIASHDPLVFDSPLTDRVMEMRDGRIIGEADGP